MRSTDQEMRANDNWKNEQALYANVSDFQPGVPRPRTKDASHLRWKILVGLVLFLTLMFLILTALTSLLFIYYSRINLKMSHPNYNDTACGRGWLQFKDSCYFFSTLTVNWETAQLICQTKESNLVIITSHDEQGFINKYLPGFRYWIGLIEEDDNRVFKWLDGTSLSYSNWNKGEPLNAGGMEHCVHMWSSGFWNDVTCTEEIFPICERKV